MTAQLVRRVAKEIAGAFYEQEQRTLRFRRQWPSVEVYQSQNWQHFVDLARGQLASMLADPSYPEHRKEALAEELLKEHARQQSPHARSVIQASMEYVEKDERKSLDASHHLPNVSG